MLATIIKKLKIYRFNSMYHQIKKIQNELQVLGYNDLADTLKIPLERIKNAKTSKYF